MYDFIDFSQGTNFYLNLYCFLLYCVLLLISLRGNVIGLNSQEPYRIRKLLLFSGLLLFALTSFVGADFFFYHENMSMYSSRVFGDQDRGLELVYQYLIYYTNGDYFLFRLVVWGVSLLLIVLNARKFGANVYNTLFIILAGFIVTYSYARATLAMAIFFLGVILICVAINKKWKLFRIIIGICLIASSIYFHRSMLPMVALALVWIIIPWKKKITKYSLWFFPLFVALFYFVIKTAFEGLFAVADVVDDDSGSLYKMEHYSEHTVAATNMNGYIRLVFHYSVFVLPILMLANILRSGKILRILDDRAIWLYQIIFLIFAFALSFVFLGFGNSVLFDRYLYMTFIPLSILIVYMRGIGALNKQQYFSIIGCFILSNLFQLFAYVYSVREVI